MIFAEGVWLLIKILIGLIGVSGLIIAILIWAFTNLEQIEILISWINRGVAWVSRSRRRKAISTQIQARINSKAEAIETEAHDVMPNPLRIEWIGEGDEFAKLQDGEIVVYLHDELDDARNIVTAALLYLGEGCLRDARPYVDPSVGEALDLTMAWRILGAYEESDVAHYFMDKIYIPKVGQDEMITEYVDKLDGLEKMGTLTRVLMREFRGVGRKCMGVLPRDEHWIETRRFADFLHTIVSRQRGERVPLDFDGKYIKASLELVARIEVIQDFGLRFHKRWLRRKVKMGIETIYIQAIRRDNVDLAHRLAQWGQDNGIVEVVRRQIYQLSTPEGRTRQAIIITCHSTEAVSDVVLDPEEEVHALLVRQIPEITYGRIEVMDIARDPGNHTKVIIQSNDPNIQLTEQYVYEHLRPKAYVISEELQESVWLVPWTEDPEEFVIKLLGVPTEDVVSVDVRTSGRREAEVVVTDQRTAARAIGSQGTNVKLVQDITGLRISIVTEDEAEADESERKPLEPEAILREALVNEIPEIASGEIEIVDLVREPGGQSKVVVKRPDEEDPIPCCLGKRRAHVQHLMEELGESIWFVRWTEDSREFLANCLGVPMYKIESIEIIQQLKTAKVVVRDGGTAARAIGESGINVKLATHLTNLRRINISSSEDN